MSLGHTIVLWVYGLSSAVQYVYRSTAQCVVRNSCQCSDHPNHRESITLPANSSTRHLAQTQRVHCNWRGKLSAAQELPWELSNLVRLPNFAALTGELPSTSAHLATCYQRIAAACHSARSEIHGTGWCGGAYHPLVACPNNGTKRESFAALSCLLLL